jgi:hypothetical protein
MLGPIAESLSTASPPHSTTSLLPNPTKGLLNDAKSSTDSMATVEKSGVATESSRAFFRDRRPVNPLTMPPIADGLSSSGVRRQTPPTSPTKPLTGNQSFSPQLTMAGTAPAAATAKVSQSYELKPELVPNDEDDSPTADTPFLFPTAETRTV